MKFYRIIVLMCIIAALALVFAACNKDKADETKSEETTTSAATTAEPRFDYFEADASEYISIDESVYNEMVIELNDVYHIDDEDIDSRIEKLLVANKTKLNDGAKVTGDPIKSGDSAFIFYKGVIDGKEFEGGSNMGDATPYELSIGSGTFIEGFEEGLIGVIPSNTRKVLATLRQTRNLCPASHDALSTIFLAANTDFPEPPPPLSTR